MSSLENKILENIETKPKIYIYTYLKVDVIKDNNNSGVVTAKYDFMITV